MRSVGSWQDQLVDDAALSRPDLLAGRDPRTLNMSRLGEILLDEQPPVRAMIVWNSNPLVIVPNAEKARDGMARDDLFTIVHEQFLTDTAKYADIVLPATTHIEASDVTTAWGHLWMGWNEAAIEPLGEAVSNSECFRRIAAAMGLTEPLLFDDDLSVLKAALPDCRPRRAASPRLDQGAVPRRRPTMGRRRFPDASRARSSSSAPGSRARGTRHCRRSSRPAKGPAASTSPVSRCSS